MRAMGLQTSGLKAPLVFRRRAIFVQLGALVEAISAPRSVGAAQRCGLRGYAATPSISAAGAVEANCICLSPLAELPFVTRMRESLKVYESVACLNILWFFVRGCASALNASSSRLGNSSQGAEVHSHGRQPKPELCRLCDCCSRC